MSQTASLHAAVSNVPPSAFETYLTPYDDAEGRLLQFLDQAKSRCYGVDVEILTDKTQAAGKREQAVLAYWLRIQGDMIAIQR